MYKIKKRKFYLADPARGLLTVGEPDFRVSWLSDKTHGHEQGIALLLEPSPSFYNSPDDTRDKATDSLRLKNIFNYLMPYKKLVFQVFVGLAAASLLQLFLPFLTQSIVDTGVNTANIQFVYIVLIAQVSLLAGRLVIEFVRGWILLHISTRINVSILTDFLIKMMKLPVSFFDTKHTGDILQRMNDHTRIESFLTGSSLNVLFSLINLSIFSFVLAILNKSIFSVFLMGTALYSLWVILFLRRRKILDYQRFAIAAREQSTAIQLIQGMQEIKLNGAERPMRWTWERLQAKLFRVTVKSVFLNQWQQTGAFFLNEGKNFLITFISAKAVINGHMTLGSMIAVQYIIGQLSSPIEQMIGFLQSFQNAKISMDRLNEIHKLDDEEPAAKCLLKELPSSFTKVLLGGKEQAMQADFSMNNTFENEYLPEIVEKDVFHQHGICLQNISFTYPGAGSEPVLRNINLTIPRGKTTAIVGMSGSGKTTLLKLLLKFYEPQKGEIKLDYVSLNNVSHKVWRAHCGVVMQESFIFSDTIARNIAVGIGTPDLDRLHHACEIANIVNFIQELPLGYNTKIGAEGCGISMGQKQRILIARAVYRDPQFIFFDEATNSLDANNESAIIHNLASFFTGRTVIVVAHRLSTVRHADQIVILNNGVIVEKGTHQELVNLRREYYTLVKNQLELGA